MAFGHANEIVGYLNGRIPRYTEDWAKAQEESAAKVGGYFLVSHTADKQLEGALFRLTGEIKNVKYPWSSYTEKTTDAIHPKDASVKPAKGPPVLMRAINLNKIKPDMSKEEQRQILADLHKLGVNAITYTHEYKQYDKDRAEKTFDDLRSLDIDPTTYTNKHAGTKLVEETLLCVPRDKLDGDPKNPTKSPDFEGSALFLSYMLEKGYLKEKDLEPNRTFEHEYFSQPFDKTLLSFAQEPQFQNPVRKLLGEELLPEKPAKIVGPKMDGTAEKPDWKNLSPAELAEHGGGEIPHHSSLADKAETGSWKKKFAKPESRIREIGGAMVDNSAAPVEDGKRHKSDASTEPGTGTKLTGHRGRTRGRRSLVPDKAEPTTGPKKSF